eukprot:8485553-Heterocapsa_arctica.AAC.1
MACIVAGPGCLRNAALFSTIASTRRTSPRSYRLFSWISSTFSLRRITRRAIFSFSLKRRPHFAVPHSGERSQTTSASSARGFATDGGLSRVPEPKLPGGPASLFAACDGGRSRSPAPRPAAQKPRRPAHLQRHTYRALMARPVSPNLMMPTRFQRRAPPLASRRGYQLSSSCSAGR